jgi:hypothetical protein
VMIGLSKPTEAVVSPTISATSAVVFTSVTAAAAARRPLHSGRETGGE